MRCLAFATVLLIAIGCKTHHEPYLVSRSIPMPYEAPHDGTLQLAYGPILLPGEPEAAEGIPVYGDAPGASVPDIAPESLVDIPVTVTHIQHPALRSQSISGEDSIATFRLGDGCYIPGSADRFLQVRYCDACFGGPQYELFETGKTYVFQFARDGRPYDIKSSDDETFLRAL